MRMKGENSLPWFLWRMAAKHCVCVCFIDCLSVKDLKSDRCRTQMAAARAVLEKSTMMLLTTTKVH